MGDCLASKIPPHAKPGSYVIKGETVFKVFHNKGGNPMKRIVFAAFLISLLLASTQAFAACNCADKVTSDNYAVRAPARLIHGVINLGFGWTELLTEPYTSVKNDGQNVVDGIFDGLGNSIYYSALGAWDIVTFWFPGKGGKDIAVKECVFMQSK